ncbi:MAG: chemotaxis protein CheD [Candidatus Wallacebacter cryptica]|jgi:chemotaxis protein CheD|nr:chemotaxis protein CheD [Bacillota bacterium]
MNEVFVNMGEIRVMRDSGILTTVGLGSCVGVSFYDSAAKVGALAHIFLAESRSNSDSSSMPGKYADTAIPALIDLTLNAGASRERLVAKIAGGAHLFSNITPEHLSVGYKNVKAVIKQLELFNIPILGKDIAGNRGRKMKLFVDSGVVMVTTIGGEPKEI